MTPPRLLALAVCCACACLARPLRAQDAGSPAVLDSLNGWVGITLETPQDHMPGLQGQGRFQGLPRYTRPADSSLCRALHAERITYYFYRRQLHSFELTLATRPAAEQLLARLQHDFGPGEQVGFAPQYYWRGAYVQAHYDQNLLTGRTQVRFESIPLQRQRESGWAD